MNIIVVGCGKVGLTIAEQLIKEKHNVTIIDKNEKTLRRAVESIDVLGIQGNGAVLKTQGEAGIRQTDVLIAATDSDEINMLCCLLAKKEANCSTIARIRSPEYTDELAYLRDELNLGMVINPEMSAAREVERLLRFPSAMKIDSFSRGKLDLIRVRVPEESVLCGKQLKELPGLLDMNVLICVIERGKDVLIPSGISDIQAGDIISFIAKPADTKKVLHAIGINYTPVRSCIVVGGGRIAYYLARYVQETRLDIRLKIIDNDYDRCFQLSDEFPKASIVNGDGTDQELLLREGVENTDAFCSLTGFDEENIMLSLYAGKLTNARLITKINRLAFGNVIDEMSLGSVLYPRKIAADAVVQHVRALENSQGSNVETLYKIAEGRAEALEFRVGQDEKLVGHSFAELHFKPNVLVGAIVRGRQIITPRGSDKMLAGDRVIIITTNTGFNDLKDILA